MDITWTAYLKDKAELRGFRLESLEDILRYSAERYYDSVTQNFIVVGWAEGQLALVPYEQEGESVVPLTVHGTTRQQINYRLTTGRFKNA